MVKKLVLCTFFISPYAIFAQQSNPQEELESAVYANDAKRIRAAVKAGANPNGGNYAGHFLGIAASNGNLLAVKALVDLKADVNKASSGGWTAAMGAADNGHLKVLKFLASKGADLNASTRQGRTVLMRASYHGEDKVIAFLLSKKVSVHSTDYNGVTALMLAAQAGHLSTVKILLKAGADRNAQTHDKRTALSMVSLILQEDSHTSGGNTKSEIYKRYKPIEALLKARTLGPAKAKKPAKGKKRKAKKHH